MKNISCNQKQVLNIIKLVLICSILMILLWVGKWLGVSSGLILLLFQQFYDANFATR